MKLKNRCRGVSYLEVMVVLAIAGVLAAALYPDVMNALQTRSLESLARDVSMEMTKAKFQAVKTKVDHRVRFEQEEGRWYYLIEKENADGTWEQMANTVKKYVDQIFVVTVDLPDSAVVFSSLGMVSNYQTAQNTVSVQSNKLKSFNQPDVREIRIYAGGSIQYNRISSE